MPITIKELASIVSKIIEKDPALVAEYLKLTKENIDKKKPKKQ